ncbi:tetratricopeptide repeat-containing glycosyltransferase family 2 protein [Paenibacillus fonticola]|uniref:tetratricopeptide repeat-containing glycosyltransferase family 2 protein n=1 Tax=Paenibacillus fonticola TaxID=379896 RepID=UPI00036DC0DC|nr:glycosyltransferase family 2 protein [Paenibacillus fonticola]
MATISLCMIVKNEEDTIARCLASVQNIVDEIIIVDTGSSDNTIEIVSEFTPNVYHFQWIDDFAAARNFSFSKAAMDYILWMDADDVLSEENGLKLLLLKNSLGASIDSVMMKYILARDEYGKPNFSVKRNRLVRRERDFKWKGFVHEYLEVGGNIIDSDIEIEHHSITETTTDRNLKIYEKHYAEGEHFSPRDLYYFANELYDHGFYKRARRFYLRFLRTGQGWVEDNINACGKVSDCCHFLGEHVKSLDWAFRSFHYDAPRADHCCRIGYYFMQKKQWDRSIYWYKTATSLDLPKEMQGFINYACWTWLPHLQLCVCYSNIGEYELAYEHNELARKYRPTDPQIMHNKEYLETVQPSLKQGVTTSEVTP